MSDNKNNNSPLDEIFLSLTEKYNENENIRNSVSKKLQEAIASVDFNPAGKKSTTILAELDLIKTLDNVLNNSTANQINIAKLLLQRKESENNENAQAAVVEMLKNIQQLHLATAKDIISNKENIENVVKEAYENTNSSISYEKEISEDELTLPEVGDIPTV